MSWWKILAGTVIGVGAVAAAPFTGGGSVAAAIGGFGVLTGAGALIGGLGGAALGLVWSSLDQTDKDLLEDALRENGELVAVLKKKTIENDKLAQTCLQLMAKLRAKGMENASLRKIIEALLVEKGDASLTYDKLQGLEGGDS